MRETSREQFLDSQVFFSTHSYCKWLLVWRKCCYNFHFALVSSLLRLRFFTSFYFQIIDSERNSKSERSGSNYPDNQRLFTLT
jgi:hypothetical protein